MDKRKRIIATAVASLGLFVFAGCATEDVNGENAVYLIKLVPKTT